MSNDSIEYVERNSTLKKQRDLLRSKKSTNSYKVGKRKLVEWATENDKDVNNITIYDLEAFICDYASKQTKVLKNGKEKKYKMPWLLNCISSFREYEQQTVLER